MTSACACTTIYYIYNVHALLVLYFCSQSVKDRVSCPPFWLVSVENLLRSALPKCTWHCSHWQGFSESECKGTAFFWTGKIFHQFFSRKMRKKTRWDKKKGDLRRKRRKTASLETVYWDMFFQFCNIGTKKSLLLWTGESESEIFFAMCWKIVFCRILVNFL